MGPEEIPAAVDGQQPAAGARLPMRDYLAATAGIPIEKSVYLEVDVDPSQQQAEADYIAELCRRGEGPLAAAVISGRPAAEGFRDYITPFKGHRHIRGLRQVLHGESTPAGYCLQKPFIAGIRLLGRAGPELRHLHAASRVARRRQTDRRLPRHVASSSTTAATPTCRSKDQTAWKQRHGRRSPKRKNVVGKVSGIIASADAGQVDGRRPGADRQPHAGRVRPRPRDVRRRLAGLHPGATYRQWFDARSQIVANRPQSEQRRLFHDNAIRHYRLAGE